MNRISENVVVDLDSYRKNNASRPSIATKNLSFQPKWDAEVKARIEHLLAMPIGWDNSDAKKVDPWTADFANKLLHYVWPVDGHTPFVAPTCYGGLQFEWRLPDLELEIEVVRRHHLEVFIWDARDESESHFTCSHDLTELFKAVNKFSERIESGLNEATAA